MKKRLLIITGSPGTGKTSVLQKTIEALRARGYSVGGMVSREIRTSGTRAGFEILDLSSGEKGRLAHVNQKSGPRVGRYRVNLEDLEGVGVKAIDSAVEKAHVVAIDEIGPMELYSERFREAARSAAKSGKLVISTVQWRLRERIAEIVGAEQAFETFKVTYENRGNLHEDIVMKAVEFLEEDFKK